MFGVLAAGLVLGAAAGASVAQASPGSARTAIVSLGDSYLSGEGGRWLGNGTDPLGTRSGTDRAALDCDGWLCEYDPARVYGDSEGDGCHRSDVAPIRSAPIRVDDAVNLACSGVTAANLWPAASGGRGHFGEPPQADQLAAIARREEVRMIVVTVGANDLGFGDLVSGCALDWAESSPRDPELCRGEADAELRSSLPTMELAVGRALRGIRRTMAAASYGTDEYRLVAMGYASPLPPGPWLRYPEDGWRRLTEGGCPFWNADADWAAGPGIGAIDAAIGRAAAATGAELLDIRHALDGHQLCDRRSQRVGSAGPDPASADWVRRLSFLQGSSRESLHPNAYGQRALGACIGLLYASPPGEYSCGDTPGRSYVGGMRIERG
jgi:GDSL-like Lipase/Acylhydrolase family